MHLDDRASTNENCMCRKSTRGDDIDRGVDVDWRSLDAGKDMVDADISGGVVTLLALKGMICWTRPLHLLYAGT